jgi:NAD+ synthase (glutamine-hydrolysing)
VCGYTCEDGLFEPDTVRHCWEVVAEIIKDSDLTKDILCDIGMPVLLNSVLYNCRVFILNQEVILIRPKLHMAGGDNYREMRWFRPWDVEDGYGSVDFELP